MYANDILNKSSRNMDRGPNTQTRTHTLCMLELVMNMIFCKPHTNLDGYPSVLFSRSLLLCNFSLFLFLLFFPPLLDPFIRSRYLLFVCLSIEDVVKVEYMLAKASNKKIAISL